MTVKPQLVVLDLNGTLCLRPKKNAAGARKAVPRPFVSTFLEYLLHPVVRSDETIQPRFAVAVSLDTNIFHTCWTDAINDLRSGLLRSMTASRP